MAGIQFLRISFFAPMNHINRISIWQLLFSLSSFWNIWILSTIFFILFLSISFPLFYSWNTRNSIKVIPKKDSAWKFSWKTRTKSLNTINATKKERFHTNWAWTNTVICCIMNSSHTWMDSTVPPTWSKN